MVQAFDLTKSFGSQVLFAGVSFALGKGERLGLVGRNGSGKTTLLRIVTGDEAPDSGRLSMPSGYRIGHLGQLIRFTRETIRAEGALGLRPEERDDGYKVESVLSGLGFTKADMDAHPETFSGGFRIRIELAKVLVSHPDLLLLDEPTNFLDIVAVRWLRRLLRSWPGELVLVTHDREFMDGVTTHTMALHRQKARKTEGGTRKLYDQLALEEEVHERTRLREERKRREAQAFIDRFRAKASKASVVQSRIRALEKLPVLDRLAQLQSLDFRFTEAPNGCITPVVLDGVTFAYPGGPPLIEGLSMRIAKDDRIGVIGKNGRGKSTLLRLLAGELAPLEGSIRPHPDALIGFFGQSSIERLAQSSTVEDEVAAANPALGRTRVRGICGAMMFDGDLAQKRVSVLSGGERARTVLGRILARPTNLLLLDEPTNHLDMESIEAMLESIADYAGAVVIVTHSERILREVATRLVVFHRGRVEVVEDGYDGFLERIGWEDEADLPPCAPARTETAAQGAPSRKEIRQRRARIVRDRSAALGPLKGEIDAIEAEIVALEERIRLDGAALAEASAAGDGARIAALARSVGQNQRRVEALFDRLVDVSRDYENASRRFDALMAQVEADARPE